MARDRMPDEEWASRERLILAARTPNGRRPPSRVAFCSGFRRLQSLVELFYNKLKSARCAATIFDTTAESFLGCIDTAPIRIWSSHLST